MCSSCSAADPAGNPTCSQGSLTAGKCTRKSWQLASRLIGVPSNDKIVPLSFLHPAAQGSCLFAVAQDTSGRNQPARKPSTIASTTDTNLDLSSSNASIAYLRRLASPRASDNAYAVCSHPRYAFRCNKILTKPPP
jgi:hypothetical protein